MRGPTGTVARGVVGGVVAATAVAAWFFLIDTIEGRPFFTPSFLASALTGSPAATGDPGFGAIALFTLFHYAAFVAFGILASWIVAATGIRAGLLLGLVIGLLLFDLTFYAGVTMTGVDVVRELGWAQVLIGDLLAGALLAVFLQRADESVMGGWREYFATHRTVREGVVGGLIAAGVVAVWFLAFDLLNGRALFTPAALGSALFQGASSVDDVTVSLGIVAAYTFVHLAMFILAGIAAAALVNEAERVPPLLLGIVLLFVTFEVFFMGMVAILASWILEVVAWWTVAGGNILAAIAIGIYFLRRHPALRVEMRRELEEPA